MKAGGIKPRSHNSISFYSITVEHCKLWIAHSGYNVWISMQQTVL